MGGAPEPLRVAIAGPGMIGRVHARAARDAEGVVLVGVLGRSPRSTAELAAQFGAERRYAELAELTADADVDAVIVATPNDLHAPQTIACLEAGKHVLVEKPMAMTVAEGRRMQTAARAADRRLMVGHMWRFDREARHLARALADGAIGRVVRTKGYGVHAHWGPSGWFTDPARAGGGALVDMGVHALDTARFLLGDPEPVRVYARLGTAHGEYAVDDWGVLLVTWANGAESLVESGWWSPHADGPEASTQLFGTEGYARLFPTELVRSEGGRRVVEPLAFPERSEHCDPHMYAAQLETFAEAVRAGREPVPGGAHGLAVLRICEAAYASARENRAVEIGEVDG